MEVTTANGTRRLTAAVTKEGDGYVAQCLEIDVASQGDSVDEAMANLREALELYFEDDDEHEVPGPPMIVPFDLDVSRPKAS